MQRALDAAYDRVTYSPDDTSVRPLRVDTGSSVVREELDWHCEALTLLEGRGAAGDVVDRLRS